MKRSLSILLCAAACLVSPDASAAGDSQLVLQPDGGQIVLRVLGDDPDDDWRFQISPDLANWSNAYALGTLLSGAANGHGRSLAATQAVGFYRAVRTTGLYDPLALRTVSLTFTQANWQTRLTTSRTTGSNTIGSLTLDNGAAIPWIGARYKGNSSFQMGGTKKSVNVDMDSVDPEADLLGYSTINLNNAAGDETIMRESVYFTVMERYTVCPKSSMARLYINGDYWGVYSLTQNGDGDLIREWFPSNDGDRWRAPNAAGLGGAGGGGGGGGGGGFSSPLSALSWQGTNLATYRSYYELKTSDDPTNAWLRLVHAIDVLNNTPAAELRDKVEEVLAVDRWMWFLVLENIFADDDSYWNKGADYSFYYEPESGRIHPIEHDGNEGFVPGDTLMSPVQGSTGTNRPVLSRLLAIPELRQRYLAHMRTVLEGSFHPAQLTPLIDRFHSLSVASIIADTRKNFTMTAYTNDLRALKTFVTNRYAFLTNHAELRPLAPAIVAVSEPPPPPAGSPATITARIQARAIEGIDSAWLYFRAGGTGRFARSQMFDDGAHGDGAAGDGVFGGATSGFLAGARVRYYVEARSANSAKAASFAPAHAEHDTLSYRVTTSAGTVSPVIINELMADNQATLRDPQDQFDDWIELRNLTDEPVDLSGRFLSDTPDNPRKWQFPEGSIISPHGFLVVWADENGQDTPGLHANFKLSADGEQLYLVDTDANLNGLLDSVTFGPQGPDRAYGRPSTDPTRFETLQPTPGQANP